MMTRVIVYNKIVLNSRNEEFTKETMSQETMSQETMSQEIISGYVSCCIRRVHRNGRLE